MDSNFKKKSESNLIAANHLKGTQIKCYSAAVHCSYYSVVQAILHILIHLKHRTMESLTTESNKLNQGFHETISKNIRKEYSETVNKEKASAFFISVSELKGARANAEYEDIDFNPTDANLVFGIAQNLIKELKEVFKY